MAVFVSLVGKQPAAVAVPLAVGVRVGAIEHVVLLATGQTQAEAQRLKEWCWRFHRLNCEILPISGSLAREGELLPPPECIRDWIARYANGRRIVYNAGPGLNFQVAAVAHVLPQNTRFLYPHADKLWSSIWENGQEVWENWSLADLGLDELLELCGFRMGMGPARSNPELDRILEQNGIQIPQHVVKNRSVEAPGTQASFDLAFERHGEFHVLAVFSPRWAQAEAVQRAREIQRIHHDLPGLRTRIAVWTVNPALKNRLRQSGHEVISSGRRLQAWLHKGAEKPGSRAPTLSQHSDPQSILQRLGKDHQGSGGQSDVALALCLGNDPSATLVSLFTHRPGRVLVIYDSTTPYVQEVACRLATHAARLPVGTLTFVSSNLLGRGVRTTLNRQENTVPLRVDVSPGTKAQACVLAQVQGAELWSLMTHKGLAACLADENKNIPLTAPDLVTVASIRGGDLLEGGFVPSDKEKQFFPMLAKLLARFVSAEPQANILALFDDRQAITMDWGSLSFRELSASETIVSVSYEKQTSKMKIDQGGKWLEVLVAVIFSLAGADEVRYQVKWDWRPRSLGVAPSMPAPENGQPRVQQAIEHMHEADVLARFGHRVVAVSCKAGRKANLSKARKEIEALANVCLGRLCLPVLVSLMISPSQRDSSFTDNRSAILLGLQDLADPAELKNTLLKAFQSRSTLAV